MFPTLNGVNGEVKVKEPEWSEWLQVVKLRRLGPYRLIKGVPRESVTEQHIRDAVGPWADSMHFAEGPVGREIVVVRRMTPEDPVQWWLHIGLFLAAFTSATLAGAFLAGLDPLSTSFAEIGGSWFPVPTQIIWGDLWVGLPFSIGFIGILLAHELGHYFAARYHRISVSPPYFIPFPPYFSLVGTLGAFIRLKSPLVRKSILFDVGIAGPIASFVLSVPALAWGLAHSQVVPTPDAQLYPFLIRFMGEPVRVGTSAVVQGLTMVMIPDYEFGMTVVLHPLALAGWLGLFVTALNLLPMGQLDGGHVLYAIAGKAQVWFGRAFVLVMLPLGFLWWGWWLWGGIALVISRGKLAHPPVLLDSLDVGRGRRILGWITILIFLLTFSPAPLHI
jgi:hypothetical protein